MYFAGPQSATWSCGTACIIIIIACTVLVTFIAAILIGIILFKRKQIVMLRTGENEPQENKPNEPQGNKLNAPHGIN